MYEVIGISLRRWIVALTCSFLYLYSSMYLHLIQGVDLILGGTLNIRLSSYFFPYEINFFQVRSPSLSYRIQYCLCFILGTVIMILKCQIFNLNG